jgi:hypothetical protein
VRFLPEWWPGQHFKKVGAKFREHNFEQADRPVDFVKRQMVSNSSLGSQELSSRPIPTTGYWTGNTFIYVKDAS